MKKHVPLTQVKQALEVVRAFARPAAVENIPLALARGRVLAEPIHADRPLPPYHRATMDGIAILHARFQDGQTYFAREAMARAGIPAYRLKNPAFCVEIATGAVLPEGTDTVIRYEDLEETPEGFHIREAQVNRGQNIHRQGSDAAQGEVLLPAGTRVRPAEMGVLASVGAAHVAVTRLPKLVLISSGDELVEVDEQPEPHQIRTSNTYALLAALQAMGLEAETVHLPDNPDRIRKTLSGYLDQADALLLSGGVSKGKYDFIPGVLEELGVEKGFHGVAQRPGKPFWFGYHPQKHCCLFSFPGNPISAFLNFHLYFREWLHECHGISQPLIMAEAGSEMVNKSPLVHFRNARMEIINGRLVATEVPNNGSGDFRSLCQANGFLRLDPSDSTYAKGTLLPFIPFSAMV